jgi:hypothetical protein
MKTISLTQSTQFVVTLYTRVRARLMESFDILCRLRQTPTQGLTT